MNHDAKSLAAEARKLPPEQQAELIDALLAGLQQTAPDWNAAWSTEAERRWALLQSGETTSTPAETVLSEIAAHLAKRRPRQ